MKSILWSLPGIGIGAALGWLALRGAVSSELLASISALDWRPLVLAVAAVTFAGFLHAYRWKLLLPKEKVSTTRLFVVKEMGQGLNNISPIRVLAEVAQTAMLTRRYGISAPKVVSSLLMSRMFDLLVTVNLVGAGLIILPQLSGYRPLVAPLWGMTGVALLAFLILGNRLHRIPGVRRLRPLQEMLISMGAIRARPVVMGTCIVLTSLHWMAIGTAAWLVAQTAGVGLPFWLISIVVVSVSLFGSAIPAPPGMVGVYEFMAVSTLGLFAVDPSVALTFALITHGVLFIPPLMIGIPALAMEWRTVGGALAKVGAIIGRRGWGEPQPQPSLSHTAAQ